MLRRDRDHMRVSISIGVAELSSEDLDSAALLHRADGALYRAKARVRTSSRTSELNQVS